MNNLNNSQLVPIIKGWGEGREPTPAELELLLKLEFVHPERATAFRIEQKNGLAEIERRSRLFKSVYPQLLQACDNLALGKLESIIPTIWHFWLPLAIQLAAKRKQKGRTFIQGILGGQGIGKTTLAAIINLLLESLDYTSICISLDDLYQTYEERKKLQESDPRLIWRGPPGTHDVELGVKLLDRLLTREDSEIISLPRFDKSACNGAGDRSKPQQINKKIDIVLFEGWFVGVRPIDEKVFDTAPPPIITAEDKLLARDSNKRLQAYLPLWQRLDSLIVLWTVDYRISQSWRMEAERKAIVSGKSGMRDGEIEQFVEYFWRSLHPELFIKPLISNSSLVDLVVEIKGDRTVEKIYRP